ncbi:MAG: hypothetical protein U0325_21060 [Polyangiales bacterium]
MLALAARPPSIEPARVAGDQPLNGLQRALLGALAHRVAGGDRSGETHAGVHREMFALKTLRELRDDLDRKGVRVGAS